MEILCFFAGMAFVFIKNAYPFYFLIIALYFRPRFAFIAWFCSAIAWSLIHQYWVKDQGMPTDPIIKLAFLDGYVISIPSHDSKKVQFQFRTTQLNGKPVKSTLLLSCYDYCPELHAGQHWTVSAKLKKARNLGNPGGFDYISWLDSRHITWTGYVRPNTFQHITNSSQYYPLLNLRDHLAEMLAGMDSNEKTLGITQALTLGVTSHIDKNEWELFRRTGTIHLMVISGAHIGLVAGLTYGFSKWLWCRSSRLCLRWPAPKVGSLVALLMALIYALLAGFAVPAQRALIVCFFMLLRNFLSQRFTVWQAWRYALLGVLIFEPHSVLMSGFYLSFLAVAILILINQRVSYKGIRKTLLMQLACLAGLMPLTLYWFSYGAVNGLVANLIAIPWVSFIIVPLSLFITFFGQWVSIAWLVMILKGSIMALLYYLNLIDSFALFNLNFSFTQILSPLSHMLAMCIALFIPLKRLFPAVFVLLIAGMFPSFESVKLGQARIDVLDVGQGLAVAVHTAKHILIYDTGVKFYQGSDMAKLAIIPYLNTLGIQRIDKVVISHPDLDHRGGLASLEDKFKIGELIVDDPKFYGHGSSCHQYADWNWEGVNFKFFAIKKFLKDKNNRSCVLQISTEGGQVLLSADIEKLAENYLVKQYGNKLASSVMLIPHHGSKTSSSIPFIEQVAPKYAIASYGFDNRYKFPHEQAMQGYKQRQIATYNTKDCGMVSVLLTPNELIKPICFN